MDLLQQHHQIPDEILMEEILARLPVKSLLRFRCVSKPWHEYGLKQCSLRTYLDEDDEESPNLSPIDDPTIDDDEMMKATIVGSCNGVLCLFNRAGGSFFLWNPATRNHIKLPRIEGATKDRGFGWDEWSCAFKVFVVVFSVEKRRYIGMVYSSETDSWKERPDIEYLFACGTGKFACGKIHWITYGGNPRSIKFFDLRREVFGRIEMPCNLRFRFYPWMWETRECLVFIFGYDDGDEIRPSVWVLKEECLVEVAKEPWVGLVAQPGKRMRFVDRYAFPWVESLVSPRRRRRSSY